MAKNSSTSKNKNNMSPLRDTGIRLSPSALNLFLECPRCFWLDKVKGIKRPGAPFSTLPTGMDLLIKRHFDKYRAEDKMPPELAGKVKGKLLDDQALLKKWRNWRSGLAYRDKGTDAVLSGALDECFLDGDIYIPVDYKTRGFPLKADSLKYYQHQLDCYTFLLEANDLKHASFAYLVYYILSDLKENGDVKFSIEAIKVDTHPQDALKVFQDAVVLLRGDEPEPNSNCGYCAWKGMA